MPLTMEVNASPKDIFSWKMTEVVQDHASIRVEAIGRSDGRVHQVLSLQLRSKGNGLIKNITGQSYDEKAGIGGLLAVLLLNPWPWTVQETFKRAWGL